MLKGTIFATLSALAMVSIAQADVTTTAETANTTAAQATADVKKSVKKHHKKHKKVAATVPPQPVVVDALSKYVHINSDISNIMLNRYDGVNRELALLNQLAAGKVDHDLTLGGDLQADAFWQGSNVSGYALNPSVTIPTGTGYNYDSVSAVNLTHVDLQFLNSFNSWATGYATIDGFMRGTTYVAMENRAYLEFGNLNSSPVYGLIGRNDIDFGQFATVNQYSMPLNRWLFQANGNVAEIGVNTHGFNIAVSAMNGGQQSTVIDQTNLALTHNLQTLAINNNGSIGDSEAGADGFSINNYAVNAGYDTKIHDDMTVHVGGGLLRGSQFAGYNNANGNANANANLRSANPAWDVNGNFTWKALKLLAEFTSTFYPITPVNNYTQNTQMMAWQLGGEYGFNVLSRKLVASAEYSAITNNALYATVNGGVILSPSSPTSQYVFGLRSEIIKNITTGLEYAYDQNTNGNYLGDTNGHFNTITLDVTAMF